MVTVSYNDLKLVLQSHEEHAAAPVLIIAINNSDGSVIPTEETIAAHAAMVALVKEHVGGTVNVLPYDPADMKYDALDELNHRVVFNGEKHVIVTSDWFTASRRIPIQTRSRAFALQVR